MGSNSRGADEQVAGRGAVAELPAGAPWKTVGSGNRNKRRQGKQPAGREHHREAGKEIAPAASRERAPRAASEQKRERQNPLS